MWDDISLWFWFAFPWWLVMLSIFSCACWPSICILLKKGSILIFCPFSIRLFVFFNIKMYEFFVYFWYELLMQCIVCRYLLHSVGGLFMLLMVSFTVPKLFHSICFFLLSVFLASRDISKKIVLRWLSENFSTYVFFQEFYSFRFYM